MLNSQKKIAAESVAAIQDAVSAGKKVVLFTGRALAQVKEC
ncbi:hypothetical protein STRDD11_01858 [Streptococcus sp. DD11]|nr:hypothetical protein STRDD11_01858 [Streptococcus sp. DD11]